jgi:hypothetical protein
MSSLNIDWLTPLVAAPLLVLLVVASLHLDTRLSAPRHKNAVHPGNQTGKNDKPFLADPNGHPWVPAARGGSH